jgi:hypothetical protein
MKKLIIKYIVKFDDELSDFLYSGEGVFLMNVDF